MVQTCTHTDEMKILYWFLCCRHIDSYESSSRHSSSKMGGGSNAKSQQSQEIVEEYLSSLVDLTINSKPLISMLTLLADDYIDHADAIVETIENYLQKVNIFCN